MLARLERDGGGFRVVLASAGHPPALVVRADGRVEECHVAGTLLGITDEAGVRRRRDASSAPATRSCSTPTA